MKKIIRFLANISGVSDQIRAEVIRETGARLNGDHFWWNGGLMFPNWSSPDLMNAFLLYGRHMMEYGTYPDIDKVRNKVVAMGGKYIGLEKDL